jgi:hypothetical protein
LVQHRLLQMKLSFKIGETKLDESEATALISTTSSPSTPLVVDISDHVDPAMFNVKKLFNLSVESKNPVLASLAARFAIDGAPAKKSLTGKRPYRKGTRISDLDQTEVFTDPGKVVGRLSEIKSIRALGAVMILNGLSSSDNRSVRRLATSVVNKLALHPDVPSDCACFRGFEKDEEGFYRPVAKDPSVSRNMLYHTSPTYTAMRDGAKLLKQWGLISLEPTIEYGSIEKDGNDSGNQLRRTVYKITLTEMGKKVMSKWEDSLDFVVIRWTRRN